MTVHVQNHLSDKLLRDSVPKVSSKTGHMDTRNLCQNSRLSEVINHHSPGGVLKTRLGIHIDQKLEEKKEEKKLEETAPVLSPMGKSSGKKPIILAKEKMLNHQN